MSDTNLSEQTTSAYLRAGDVMRDIADARFIHDRPDFLPAYLERVRGVRSGTVMPCSPGVARYHVEGQYNPVDNMIYYRVDWELRPRTIASIKSLPRQQILHRSRDIALAARPLQEREFSHRMQRIRDNQYWLSHLQAMASNRQKVEMWDALIDSTLSHLKLDMRYLRAYIKEHATSSTGTGHKWGELDALPDEYWRQIFGSVRTWMEKLSSTRYEQMYVSVPYHLGMRARSNPLKREPDLLPCAQQGIADRSRIVMYRACLSMPGAFIPDKTGWYKEVFDKCHSILSLNNEVHYPMIEGGNIYQVASDLLNKGYRHYAYDGGSWESVVGEVFAGVMDPMLTQLGSMSTLPSGIFTTSALGTMCSMIAATSLLGADDEAIILGDDINIYSKRDRSKQSMGDLVSFQPIDTDVQFLLGVSYKWDINAPRITGFKITTDRADKSLHLDIDESGIIDERVEGKADERSVELWNGLYHGFFGYETLLNALKSVEPHEFRGGSEIIHQMASEGYRDVTLEEAEGWSAADNQR